MADPALYIYRCIQVNTKDHKTEFYKNQKTTKTVVCTHIMLWLIHVQDGLIEMEYITIQNLYIAGSKRSKISDEMAFDTVAAYDCMYKTSQENMF